MSEKKTSIYRNDIMIAKLGPLEKRFDGLSAAITIIADRYVELMTREKRFFHDYFTPAELNLMLNNALSTTYEPAGIIAGAVLADTEDEGDEVFEAYGVVRSELIGKLKALNLGQQFALVDLLEELRDKVGK